MGSATSILVISQLISPALYPTFYSNPTTLIHQRIMSIPHHTLYLITLSWDSVTRNDRTLASSSSKILSRHNSEDKTIRWTFAPPTNECWAKKNYNIYTSQQNNGPVICRDCDDVTGLQAEPKQSTGEPRNGSHELGSGHLATAGDGDRGAPPRGGYAAQALAYVRLREMATHS